MLHESSPCFFLLIFCVPILILVVLIYQLTQSFEAIKYALPDEQRGFEVLMAQPTQPPPSSSPGDTHAPPPQSVIRAARCTWPSAMRAF